MVAPRRGHVGTVPELGIERLDVRAGHRRVEIAAHASDRRPRHDADAHGHDGDQQHRRSVWAAAARLDRSILDEGMVQVDVAVIGGGVTGLASALALAEAGASVCLLERDARPGRATSTHNCGVIHAGLYYPTGSLKARLCVEGRDRLYEFCPKHRVPHARCGKLVIAADDHEVADLEALRQKSHANGVTSVEFVDADFIKTKEPNVRAVAALWSPDTGILEAEALVKALEHLCQDRDVAMVVGSPLVGATTTADGIELATAHERFVAGTVVNAAGLYADDALEDARRHDVSHLPMPRRVRGAQAVTSGDGQRAGLSAAARIRRRPRRPPRQDDVGIGDARSDHSLPGIEGRL